jgi:putative endonuclease
MASSGALRAPSTGATGKLGERIAADYLRRQGMTVVATNLRSRLGELDILARDGGTLVFVEVKARRAGAADPPQAAVGLRKRTRLVRLALGYLAAHRLGERPCRFDVVAVTFDQGAHDGDLGRARPSVRHFPGAFDLDGETG